MRARLELGCAPQVLLGLGLRAAAARRLAEQIMGFGPGLVAVKELSRAALGGGEILVFERLRGFQEQRKERSLVAQEENRYLGARKGALV
jgi:hypothetical protein